MTRPTLYLSNFASYRTPGMHGSELRAGQWGVYAPLTIMTRPRAFERGAGRVDALVPSLERELLASALADRSDVAAMSAYRGALEARWSGIDLSPGALTYTPTTFARPHVPRSVLHNMTPCCACSVAEARAGRCHRTWAAPFLVRAGWTVILDGTPYTLPDVPAKDSA